MGIKNRKIFNVFASVWLLISFILADTYANNSSLEGLFTKIFLLGVMTSPIWTIFAYKYLSENKPVSNFLFSIVYAIYAFWFFYELDANNNLEFIPILLIISFTTCHYFSETYPQPAWIFLQVIKIKNLSKSNPKNFLKYCLWITIILLSIAIPAIYFEKRSTIVNKVDLAMYLLEDVQCNRISSILCKDEAKTCAYMKSYDNVTTSLECRKRLAVRDLEISFEEIEIWEQR